MAGPSANRAENTALEQVFDLDEWKWQSSSGWTRFSDGFQKMKVL